MKFERIYRETEENVRLALESLWVPGAHPMRRQIEELFRREPLLAEPVFQSMFGWKTIDNDGWRHFLNEEVIQRLGIGTAYPPYVHQAESWDALRRGKSIVVTSGTGSGKTECFMYPVISDLYEQGDTNAIEAIFLYPLNALMEDQKKRLSRYCEPTGLRFAVYNGSTPEYHLDGADPLKGEVGTRDQIRDTKGNGTRPHILLTNPSMLEYILVRQKDKKMLEESSGKLRWIVIDEAHTYSGSAAAELGLQINRILEAFNVNRTQVRFACTSATIGGKEGEESLKRFIKSLTGQPIDKIQVIGGERIVPSIDSTKLSKRLHDEDLPDLSRVLKLRHDINSCPGMSLENIWSILRPDVPYSRFLIPEALSLIDRLCDITVDDKQLFAVRAHMFMRAVSGIWGCANPSCSDSSGTPYGHLTTYKASVCPHCGAPLLEILQCKRCNSFILSGKSDFATHLVSPLDEEIEEVDPFALEDDESVMEETSQASFQTEFFIEPYINGHCYSFPEGGNVVTMSFDHSKDGSRLLVAPGRSGNWVEVRSNRGYHSCPDCGSMALGSKLHLKHFRVPIDLLNQTISPALLHECAADGQPWGKYIAFTDSRQGTAISAKTFNIEVERRKCRSSAIKKAAHDDGKTLEDFLNDPQYAQYPPELISKFWKEFNKGQTTDGSISLSSLADAIYNSRLHEHMTDGQKNNPTAYKAALMRQFIGRRQMYENGIETMGILTLVYPALSDVTIPEILEEYARKHSLVIEEKDWQDFLKITLDFYVRLNNHIQPLIDGERSFVRDANLGRPMSSPYEKKKDIKQWPMINIDEDNGAVQAQQPRLVRLLCAGLGINTIAELTENKVLITRLMEEAWHTLVSKRILTRVENNGEGYAQGRFEGKYVGCYYLDLSGTEGNKTARIRRTRKAWECPVTGKLFDTLFMGISPAILGDLSPDVVNKYRCKTPPLTMPVPPDNNDKVSEWMHEDDAVRILKERGLWSDRSKYLYYDLPPYLAAEHSAQQSRDRLRAYTEAFKQKPVPGINVLQCSTTMEMGVDIDEIDIVLMDTIPPTAANYLQRAGRAGRNKQSRALALSLCSSTPVAQHAFAHPMWALESANSMSPVTASRTITQRHINSYFFRKFICDNGQGIQATLSLGEFMEGSCDQFINFLDQMGGNRAAREHFAKTFGPDVDYSIDNTRRDIIRIRDEYKRIIQELEDAHQLFADEERRKLAIATQIKKLQHENLLNYLSEQQFIPNANMPTGVVSFEFMDAQQYEELLKLYKKADEKKKELESIEEGTSEETICKRELNKIFRDIRALRRGTGASREINTALNEYAPGQTVVVNEKNFRSAGLLLFGAYNDETQRRAIYHCTNCGKVEYLHILDRNRHCPDCGAPYRGIIDPNSESYTLAYEPAGFRTDQHEHGTREERTEKRYYDIRPILLSADWSNPMELNMCQITGSGKGGQILYYNRGDGFGFAFCKHCGRAAVETSLEDQDLPKELEVGHRSLWGDKNNEDICTANKSDIARHAVFTGMLYTCYAVLRFKKDPGQGAFVKGDPTLAFSLGVIIKRALVDYLGIESNEIAFGVKEEKDADLLFIYDTARGGCGYSTHLTDPAECQKVFAIALRKLQEYSCNCHEDGGACARCLIDRDNYQQSAFISKGAALDWLLMQRERAIEIPEEVKDSHADASVVYQPLKALVSQAINQAEVSEMTFVVSDLNGDCAVTDWTSMQKEMGRLIHRAIERGKRVSITIEYHPEHHQNLVDRIPFIGLKEKFPDCNVRFIADMGVIKSAFMTSSATHHQHYFTDQGDVLPFADTWGEACIHLFADATTPLFQEISAPTFPSDSQEIIRQGLTRATQFRVGEYFSKAIVPGILRKEDLDLMSGMLRGKSVAITFSDMYVNSALASIMLVYLIKEMQNMFGFKIGSLTLQVDSPKRKCENDRWGANSPIGYNWTNPVEADEYTKQQCEFVLWVKPTFSTQDADHHRWLRMELPDGKRIEIRPDHGICGGYRSYSRYQDVDFLDENVIAYRTNEDVLYYIIIKNS